MSRFVIRGLSPGVVIGATSWSMAGIIHVDIPDFTLVVARGETGHAAFDFTGDGAPDIVFSVRNTGALRVQGLGGVELKAPGILDGVYDDWFVIPHAAGELIGPSPDPQEWEYNPNEVYLEDFIKIPWPDDGAYIGMQLTSAEGDRYGWAHVASVLAPTYSSFTVFGFAYETEFGVPIRAGAIPTPGVLALLAVGAAARGRRPARRA
ncbi:MAG: hypothetical protein KF866_08475 [Phycisphaeraceae bacterium]|nr:hypothetical protein [Phycisphaeraceae bacterium]MCW5753912.1 hypothetical protein [Phycisphaeraceae bacterium]